MAVSKETAGLHRALHLQHHRHTGKFLHHKHTSFRGLAILLAIAGMCMVGISALGHATAGDIVVYATNPAPIPTDAPVITKPADGENISKSTVIVAGTCPAADPRVVIAILNDGQQVSSVACDSDNNFSVPLVVEPGEHRLVARVYTITGGQGLDSQPVTFTYSVPAPVTSAAVAAEQGQDKGGIPLVVTIDEPFIVFGPAKDAIWKGSISGGTLPYKVHINWGDGKSSDYTVRASGAQEFAHHYTSMESHLITLRVIDREGRGIIRSYAAVTPYVPPTPGTLLPAIPKSPFQGSMPLGIYGAYLVLLAAFGFLWILLHPRFAFAKIHTSSNTRGTNIFVVAAKRRRGQRRGKW